MNNLLIFLFAISLMFLSFSGRIESYLKTLSVQGLLLFMLAINESANIHWLNMAFLCVETLVIKAVVMPAFLLLIMKRNNLKRDIDPQINNFYFSLITSLIIFFGFFIAYWAINYIDISKAIYFGISVSAILEGFLIIFVREKVITHVIGFIVIENGIFLLSLAIVKELPLMVNVGVLLDIFLVVFVLGLFISRISNTFNELKVSSLKTLRD